MLIPLKFAAGVVRDLTRYANTNGWYDCDKVRFRMGLPEKIGGWQKQILETFLGTCRSLINWTVLNGRQYFGLGTNLKYYVSSGGAYTDVTPIRRTVTLGSNPFASTNGSSTITVTDTSNGAVAGDYVTYSGATGFATIPAGDFNQEHQIASIVDVNTYTIVVDSTANATTTGGGAAVSAAYQINIGLDTTVMGLGWGAGPWGRGAWGSDATAGTSLTLRLWSNDTFGEDLIANVRGGGIYYWDATSPTDRMVALEDKAGASDAPTVATIIMVSADERHVIAMGANPIGSSDADPMFIRWSATENAVDWTPKSTNTAGGYRLSIGTEIIGAAETRSEILIWTDTALYSMRWTGAPYVFSFTQLAANIALVAQNGAVSSGDVTLWMGHNQFYIYNGRVSVMQCPVADYVFSRINLAQIQKVFAFTNSHFDEVGWLYPSTTDECDSYVIYSIRENAWYYGSLSRTAWLDRGPNYYPAATSPDGYLYDQEYGFDDGSTNPPSPIEAYIESSPLEMSEEGQGEHFAFITRIIPDVTFRDSSAASPSVDMTVKMQDYPGVDFSQDYASTVTKTASVPIQQFTKQAFIRLRGRSAVFRVESDGLGVTWRLGVPRLDVRLDGRR